MKFIFHSVTPNRFACIPTWILSPKIQEKYCRVYDDTNKKFIDIEIAVLRDLMAAHKLAVRTSDDNKKYIPSYSYIRHFK